MSAASRARGKSFPRNLRNLRRVKFSVETRFLMGFLYLFFQFRALGLTVGLHIILTHI